MLMDVDGCCWSVMREGVDPDGTTDDGDRDRHDDGGEAAAAQRAATHRHTHARLVAAAPDLAAAARVGPGHRRRRDAGLRGAAVLTGGDERRPALGAYRFP